MKNHTSYDYLSSINTLDFRDKSVLLIGAGNIARHYAFALSKMKIKNVTIIGKSNEKVVGLCNEFGFKSLAGGYEKNLPRIEKKDLVIVAAPIHLLLPVTELAILNGQSNILIEKPGSLYYNDLIKLAKKARGKRIRIGYNRLVYPNLHKLKDLVVQEGGISSCHFTFTEWTDKINFKNKNSDVYKRYGIANSLHVISMALELIDLPNIISTHQKGNLSWHPSGLVFVGSGISKQNIPFSYHADWNSAGRWGIEIMTEKNAYRLIPLEELYICRRNSTEWKKVPFKIAYNEVKRGISEEIALMLDHNAEKQIKLVTLEKASEFNKVAEKIFGYNR